MDQFRRCRYLISDEKVDLLQASHVLVFGCGGVGSMVCEALVRSGLGHISVVDYDIVDITNLNRQLIAYHNTIGLKKVTVMKERLLSINPNLIVTAYDQFYDADHKIDLSPFDYVVDAIDSVPSKILLMQECEKANIPLIMSLGTGNKLNPSQLLVSDLYHTSVCPLAKKVRSQAKALGLKNIKVVYSKEEPHKAVETKTIASMMMVPGSAGLLIASEVISDIIKGV